MIGCSCQQRGKKKHGGSSGSDIEKESNNEETMDLKEMLLKEKIVRIKKENEEPFTLKSGKKSRIFIDIKQASLNPDILKEIVETVHSIGEKEGWNFDRVASVAIGGIPLATALCLRWDEHQIIVRSETHDRGMKQKIIGDCIV